MCNEAICLNDECSRHDDCWTALKPQVDECQNYYTYYEPDKPDAYNEHGHCENYLPLKDVDVEEAMVQR